MPVTYVVAFTYRFHWRAGGAFIAGSDGDSG